MSKYCPAGNIECDCGDETYCSAVKGLHVPIIYFEECPWPSKQKPIEKAPELPEKVNINHFKIYPLELDLAQTLNDTLDYLKHKEEQ